MWTAAPYVSESMRTQKQELYSSRAFKQSPRSTSSRNMSVDTTTVTKQTRRLKYILLFLYMIVSPWGDSPQWARSSSFLRFLDHTQRHTTLSRTPLDEWSARRRDLCLTTHNTHNRQASMSPPPAGSEPKIPASERPQTHALDRAATGTGLVWDYIHFCNLSTVLGDL